MTAKRACLVSLAFLCLRTGHALDAQRKVLPPHERAIGDLLWKELDIDPDFPNSPIDVLFFDINHDGVLDALVSYRIDMSGGGLHGNGWDLYRFKNGEWRQGPYKMLEEPIINPSTSVYARGDDFFTLMRDGQPPKLVYVYEGSGRNFNEDQSEYLSCFQNACEITIDGEGYLKTIPIPELTVEFDAPYDEKEGVYMYPDLGEEYDALKKQLVPLPAVETFDPRSGQQKPGTDAPVTAGGSADEEDTDKVSLPNPDGQSGAKNPAAANADGKGGEQGKPHRRWPYLAILPLILAVFYFLRKKFSKN